MQPLRVFITGATSGIGRALVRYYAERNALLGLTARDQEMLDVLARQLSTEVICYAGDVRDAQALQHAANDFIHRFGPPDIVIANAGISVGTLTEYADDVQVFQDIMDTNVLGMVKTFHPFIDAMRNEKRGTLVGIASVAGIRGLPGAGAYAASKSAAITYLESLRVELKGSGVSAVTICPGYVRTAMTAANPYPMPFILDADDAAQRIAHAIARRKSYVVIPWPMGIVAKLLRLLPNPAYDLLFKHAPHKPRKA